MKYNIAAVGNIILGLAAIIYLVIAFFAIIRQFLPLYDALNIKPNLLPSYVALILILAVGIANFFLAFKLFSKSPEIKNKYYNYSIITVVITFILTFIGHIIILSGIYNATNF